MSTCYSCFRFSYKRNNMRLFRLNFLPALVLVIIAAFPCPATPVPNLSVSKSMKMWQQIQSRGAKAFEANQYGIAERLLKEAVIKARDFEPDDVRLSQSAGELGRLLTVRGRFSEAEPYLEEELQLKERAIGNAGQLIPAKGSLIRFYLLYGTASKAEPLTEDLLSFVEGKLKEESLKAQVTIKMQMGAPLQGWAGTAHPVMRDPFLEWAITCDDLGNLYRERHSFGLADRLFKAALDVKTTILGKQHLSLANSYDSLGSICFAKNEKEEAESYFKDALTITERILPPEHPQFFVRIDKLGKCLIKEGKYQEAEGLYLRATKLWKAEPSRCGSESRALLALGCLYADEKKYSAAAPVLEQALHLAEQFHGTCSVQLVPYLKMNAYVLYYIGRKAEATQRKARADTISPVIEALKPTCKAEAGVWPEKYTSKPKVHHQ